MATVSCGLPARPHLDIPRREARELFRQWRAGTPDALERIRQRHPKFQKMDASAIATAIFRLSDAQLVIAREYAFSNWTELKQRIAANSDTEILRKAIQDDDVKAVVRLLRANPTLLHLPVWSGNWGPPMSHAANLGRLAVVQAVAQLGARDHQYAFERAVLQGRIECARWLLGQGARIVRGIVMGSCETLKPSGLRFLLEAGAPLEDANGSRLAPLASILETYSRNPAGKHEMLEIYAKHYTALPENPIVEFHRGRADLLDVRLRESPDLANRRFDYREIYPPELGCAADGRSGLHGTPVAGTTLLHLAIDFDETEIFAALLARGADVNARAKVDADGFGGHTPLFNAVVSQAYATGHQRGATMARTLLEKGARPELRAKVRKFLDWQEVPGWHEARDVTAKEWAQGFPIQDWVNPEAVALL